MVKLAALDLAIVAAYILGTTLLSLWFVRRQRDIRTYFVGDRDVAWWLVLASIVATETSAVTFLSVPGLAFNRDGGNLTFLQLTFGYVLGRCLVAWLLLPQYLRGELLSAYQLLRQRFDVRVQRVASAIFLGTRTVADGLRFFLTGLLLHQFAGWSVEVSILVMGITAILYSFLGGVQAVIWIDLLQFAVYLAGALLAAIFIVQLLPGGLDDLWQIGAAADKFQVLNFSTDPRQTYTLWAGCLGGAFFTMASHGADQIMVQRYLCSRSLGQARTALVLSGLIVMVQFLLFLLIGVGLYALWVSGVLDVPSEARNDEVFGIFIVNHLPVGVVGLIVAGVLAASMSSSLNSSAGAFVADFYRPLRPERSETHYLWVSRLMTLVWGVGQTGVALAAVWLENRRSIIDQVLAVAGFTTGLVLGLFLLGSMRRPVRSTAALVGLSVGFLAVLAVWLPSVLFESADRPWYALAWPWYAPVGTSVTVLVALVVEIGARAKRDTQQTDRV